MFRRRSSRNSSASLVSIAGWEAAVAAHAHKDMSVADFELGRTIGRGRFARVRLAKLHGVKGLPLCLKILKKSDVRQLEQVTNIVNEKDVLASARHPFIIQLFHTFQDPTRLYMALELVNGGELFNLIRKKRVLPLATARFYAAEVALALQYLHDMLVVYRDIKPENILIHSSGHIKLTDFGFAKYLKDARTYTACGTPVYMAPEIIRKKCYGFAVDWWALGVLTYEMLSGQPPYTAVEEEEIYKMVLNGRIQYPPVMDANARDLIVRLLLPDPLRRLGGGGLRAHKFFKAISWQDAGLGLLEPPWKPSLADDINDTTNFDTFEESDELKGTGGAARTSCASVSEHVFDGWSERRDLREEALARAAELQRCKEALDAEQRAAQTEADAGKGAAEAGQQQEVGKQGAGTAPATAPSPSTVPVTAPNPKHAECCVLQ